MKLSRFQFRLRTLLIVTLVVSVPCALVGRKMARKRCEQGAVTAILGFGGEVGFDNGTPWDYADLLIAADGGVATTPNGTTARAFDAPAGIR